MRGFKIVSFAIASLSLIGMEPEVCLQVKIITDLPPEKC